MWMPATTKYNEAGTNQRIVPDAGETDTTDRGQDKDNADCQELL